MSNLGSYQTFIIESHKVGGPEKLLEAAWQAGYNAGALDMKKKMAIPYILVGVGATMAIVGSMKIKKRISAKKEKKSIIKQEAEEEGEMSKRHFSESTEDIKEKNK